MFKYSDNMERDTVSITVMKPFLLTTEKEPKHEPVNFRQVNKTRSSLGSRH